MRAMRVLTAIAATTLAAMWMATCGGDGTTEPPPPPPPVNQAPVAVGSIATVTVQVGTEVSTNLSSYFNDPDGDALTYSASTSDAGVATAAVSGSQVTVTAVGAGNATITITAQDPGGLSATQTMGVVVEAVNLVPTVVGQIDDQALVVGDTMTADVAQYFEDPEGDPLTFTATSSDADVATASVDGSMLTVVAVGEGSGTISVTATDTADNSATLEFTVSVEVPNQAPQITDSIPAQTMVAGDTVQLDASGYFADPEGDELTFTAASSDSQIATATSMGSMVEIVGQASGSAAVTVTASDPEGLSTDQQFDVTVQAVPPPAIADTIPTHDMVVDSSVVLDLSPYFAGDRLAFAAMTTDDAVARVLIDGSVMTTTAVDSVATGDTVRMSVSAENDMGSATQDGILLRVHPEEYASLAADTVALLDNGDLNIFDGLLTLQDGSCLPLTIAQTFGVKLFWIEWQRGVGGGWIAVEYNDEGLCALQIEDDSYSPGRYRVIGEIESDSVTAIYQSNTIEKPKPEG